MNFITADNYSYAYFRFQARQAGIAFSYCANRQQFIYNAYCMETELLKELTSVEFEYLEDAMQFINDEFSQWEFIEIPEDTGCGSCSNKK